MTPSFKSYAVREVHGGAIADSPSAMRKPKPLTYRGGWPLGAAGSDSSFSIQGRSLETTTRMPRVGSTAAPPQLAPPLLPGICTLPRKLGGVNNPSLRALRIMSRKRARSAALRYGLRSSTVNFWRENGGGFTGNGCVGDVFSSGTSEAGTGRSSTGQSGFPVSRSNTQTKPCLVTCATTSVFLPAWRKGNRFGGVGGAVMGIARRETWEGRSVAARRVGWVQSPPHTRNRRAAPFGNARWPPMTFSIITPLPPPNYCPFAT